MGHDDEIPLQSLGPVGGEQAHGRAADSSVGKRVARDLLCEKAGDEGARPDVVSMLDCSSGHLEQGTDGVEVLVSSARPGTAVVDLATQTVGPARARPQVS